MPDVSKLRHMSPKRAYYKNISIKCPYEKIIGFFFFFFTTAQHLPHQTNLKSSSRRLRRSLRVSWHHFKKTSCGPWMTCFLFSYMWCYGPGDQSFLTLVLVTLFWQVCPLLFLNRWQEYAPPLEETHSVNPFHRGISSLLSCSFFSPQIDSKGGCTYERE